MAIQKTLELEYRLSDLPSAQHRAGLAGLVLLMQWLAQRTKTRGQCKIVKLDQYSAVIQLDLAGLGILFDELFAASWQPRKSDPQKKIAMPKGTFLADCDPSGEEKLWLALWQEVVLTILRNKSTNRIGFVTRAEGRKTNEAEKIWGNLFANSTEELSGTFLLGARAKNAEKVPFLSTMRHKFLLYFWPLVIEVYRVAGRDKDGRLKCSGYFIVIPDVSNLKLFCEVFPQMLLHRSTEKIGEKILKASLASVSMEASFETMSKIHEHTPLRSTETSREPSLLGVEVFQVDRPGQDIAIQDFSRVTIKPMLFEEYAKVNATTTNHLFRQQRLSNLIQGDPPLLGFLSLFCTAPVENTIGSYTFRQDSRAFFEQYIEENIPMPSSKKNPDNDSQESGRKVPRKSPESIEQAVYKMVSTYLTKRLEMKENLIWKGIKHDANKRAEYSEKKRAIARTTFYSVRSRSDDDFVEYFTKTLCSVSQQMSEKGFLRIAQTLFAEPEKIRTLTMVALAAQG
ncbi:MAG: type I-MYXAN CRISPR-associated protein Cmx8 [Acidobacteria bacterium]|nr:type I-MYXAN CRISPR-associated protein Cmx8 [Acidobacteriota bacterium]